MPIFLVSTVPEAHAPGTGWIDVDFTKAMCIAWNWDDLLQDASAPEENLTVADGFYEGGRNCADSLKDYISSFDGADRENTILFITGHSLGAATANVVGRLSREYAKTESNTDDVVPTVPYRIPPHYFSKIGTEHLFDRGAMGQDQRLRFERAYHYFRGMSFEEDRDLLGLGFRKTDNVIYEKLKNHLCHTYMSFILSELSDEEMSHYMRCNEHHI